MSNYAEIKNFDIANGSGISVSIFLSGCPIHCEGCFNSDVWNPESGQPFTDETMEYLMQLCSNEHIDHLSLLGGEIFASYNIYTTYEICKEFKKRFPNKKIWAWTGFTYEELLSEEYNLALGLYGYIDDIPFLTLNLIDVLIDGRFIEKQKDLTLPYMGSKNQRVIDVQKSLKQDKVILYDQ